MTPHPAYVSSLWKNLKVDMKQKFLFSRMKVHEKTRTNAVDCLLIAYLVPEISTFREQKRETQTLFNNNSQNYGVIRFACLSSRHKISYNSTITKSNPLKLYEQKVAAKISIFVEFRSSFSIPGPFHSE